MTGEATRRDGARQDQLAHFRIMVAEACLGACLANVELCVRLADGRTIVGIPSALTPADQIEVLDELGYDRAVTIAGQTVDLAAVSEITLRSPDGATDGGRGVVTPV